jgi:hypothetical protein
VFLLRLIAGVAVLLIVLAIWYFGFHQPRKRQSAATERGVTSPPEDDEGWPSRIGRLRGTEEAAPTSSICTAIDDRTRQDYLRELRALLNGESHSPTFKEGGFYNHRSRLRFLVVHHPLAKMCVIVRAKSANHQCVSRYVVSMTRGGEVMLVTQERVPPEGMKVGIARSMAENIGVKGADSCPAHEIGFLIRELSDAYRVQTL